MGSALGAAKTAATRIGITLDEYNRHVAGFVLAMVEADARIAAATNKFQN